MDIITVGRIRDKEYTSGIHRASHQVQDPAMHKSGVIKIVQTYP